MKTKEVIYIEIAKSTYKENMFKIRIGDISGASEHSNISKEEIMEEIEDAIAELENTPFKSEAKRR